MAVPDTGELPPDVSAELDLQAREEEWFLQDCTQDRKRREKKKRKVAGRLHRQKSWRWVCEVDNQLNMPPFSVGGLARFRVPEDWESIKDERCLELPCLVLSADQGPDSWCAQNWLSSPQHGRLCLVREPDSHNHGLHNDVLGSVMDIGFGSFLYSATIVLNLHFLPWNNGSFGKKIVQAAESMRQSSDHTHPVFNRFCDTIGHEKGFCDVDMMDPDSAKQIWDMFLDSASVNTAGQKVGMCRWFQVFVSMRRLFPDWTSLLVVLIRANQGEPWMANSVLGSGLVAQVEVDAAMPGVGERKMQTKDSVADEIRQLRKAVRNAMHFAMCFLSNPLHRQMCGLVVWLTSSVQEWYHSQAKTLKSNDSGRTWMLEQLAGSFWVPLRSAFRALHQEGVLQDLGFVTRLTATEREFTDNHAGLCDEEYMAMHAGKFVQAMIKRRVFRSAWFIYGWPGRLCGLLGEEGIARSTMLDLRQHYEAYEAISGFESKYFKARSARSPFKLPSVHQLVEPIRADGWVLSDRARSLLKLRESGFKQSRVVEDGFLKERRAEAAVTNFEMAEVGVVVALTQSEILTSRFSFKTHAHDQFHQGSGERLPAHAFRARTSDATMDISSIRGPKSTPAWITHSPGSWTKFHLEPYLMAHLHRTRSWAASELAWLTNLLPNHEPVLVRALVTPPCSFQSGFSSWVSARALQPWYGQLWR